jgi:hypothetical protein
MSVRLRYKLSLAVSSSQAEENDLGNTKFEVVSDSCNEGGVWKTTLAAATTMTLNLDDITTAKLLMLRMTPKDPTQKLTAVGLTINAAVLPALYPVGDMNETIFMMSTSGITAVVLSNMDPAAVPVDVIVGVSGD